MTHEAPNDFVAKLRDMVLDRSSAYTEDFTDAEATPFIDWTITQADRVGTLYVDDPDTEAKAETLMSLMATMAKLVARRYDKDVMWLTETLNNLDNYSQMLGGPTLLEEQRAVVLDHNNKTNLEMLQQLMTLYTPTSETDFSNEELE